MAKKITALTTVTVLPQHITAEAGKFMPKQNLAQLSFWNKMKEREQEILLNEAKGLSAAMLMHGTSGLAIGQHLVAIQEALRPYKKAFAKFLRNFRFTERSAYRYIIAYSNAAARLPEPVLRAAMARGMNILGYSEEKPLGKYTQAYEILKPLPRNPDPQEAGRILDQLEKTRKEHMKRVKKSGEKPDAVDEKKRDPDFLLIQNFRAVKNALRHMSSRRRPGWVESLIGMVLTELGVSGSKSFKPEAIPEHFRQGRGRPRLVDNNNNEESAAANA